MFVMHVGLDAGMRRCIDGCDFERQVEKTVVQKPHGFFLSLIFLSSTFAVNRWMDDLGDTLL